MLRKTKTTDSRIPTERPRAVAGRFAHRTQGAGLADEEDREWQAKCSVKRRPLPEAVADGLKQRARGAGSDEKKGGPPFEYRWGLRAACRAYMQVSL